MKHQIANETAAERTLRNRAHRHQYNNNVRKRKENDNSKNAEQTAALQKEDEDRQIVEMAMSELPLVAVKHLVHAANIQVIQDRLGLDTDRLEAWTKKAMHADRTHQSWMWVLVEE